MGTWGVGVFANDLACEIRDAYRDWLGEGFSAEEARDGVLHHWAEPLNDVDDGPVIWLALAVTQWKLGRLDEPTRTRALAVIENGEALNPWRDEKRGLRQREAVLAKVQEQLRSRQPAPKVVRKRFRDTCEWQVGELVSYRMQSGTLVVFRVIGHHVDLGGTSPVVEVLDWTGRSLPSVEDIQNCSIRRGRVVDGVGPIPAWAITQLFIGRVSERELPKDRVERLGITSPPTQKIGGFGGASWKWLDRTLGYYFEIE